MFTSNEQDIVLSYPKLKSRLQKSSNTQVETEKAIKYFNEMRADYSKTVMTGFRRFLDPLVGKFYDSVNLSPAEGIDFKTYVEENSVVLVPNHQSHADYILMNYSVFKQFKIPLYIAGGINLNIFPIGILFKKTGCFFIRRSFNSDILYKFTLEAYLYYLLKEGKPIEFFFEGGRSRTGKLLPPRYGLYQMLLQAYDEIPENERRPIKFIPVSIAHEYVPEQKSLAKELSGGEKQKESTGQMLKLLKLFSYQMGSVHLRMGEPLSPPDIEDLKERTQQLAFSCFLSVGKNMLVTPTSLLALILLDEPSGAVKWKDIQIKGAKIISYCQQFNVPFADSLVEGKLIDSLKRAIDILINNKKINVIGNSGQGHLFYSIKPECRGEILFFKNTILHHFIVPWIINSAWLNVFNGNITTVPELKKFLLHQRKEMKFEFYLLPVKEYVALALKMISNSVGRKVTKMEECLELNHKELYSIVKDVSVFSVACNYIVEGYYLGGLTLRNLVSDNKPEFKMDEFLKKAKETYDVQRSIGQLIKYEESYSIPLMKNCLKYLTAIEVIEKDSGAFIIKDIAKLDKIVMTWEDSLSEEVAILSGLS
jgi:glycerol-3-phosphate O-acyltransferase